MSNCEIRLPRPRPEPTIYHPTTGKRRIERQSTVNQLYRGVNVFAEIGEHIGGPAKDTWVVIRDPKCLSRKIEGFPVG